jgi:hypothetical protein
VNAGTWVALATAAVSLMGAATAYLRSVIAHQSATGTAQNLNDHLQSQIPAPAPTRPPAP